MWFKFVFKYLIHENKFMSEIYLGQLRHGTMLVELPIRTSEKVLKRQTIGCLWSGKDIMIHLIVGLIKC